MKKAEEKRNKLSEQFEQFKNVRTALTCIFESGENSVTLPIMDDKVAMVFAKLYNYLVVTNKSVELEKSCTIVDRSFVESKIGGYLILENEREEEDQIMVDATCQHFSYHENTPTDDEILDFLKSCS